MFVPAVVAAAIAPILVQSLPAPDLFERDYPVTQGALVNHFPDCSSDPTYNPNKSEYKDGDGQYVTSSCDNGLTTPAVNRFHCWVGIARFCDECLLKRFRPICLW